MPSDRRLELDVDPDLAERLEQHALDAGRPLSDWVAQVLEEHLAQQRLSLQPLVHVEDLAASVAFYATLGARVEHAARDGDFAMLRIGGIRFGLLAHPPNPDQNEGVVELNFETAEPLEELEERLRAEGTFVVQPASDTGFGRQLQVSAPDGLLVKINQLEEGLYT